MTPDVIGFWTLAVLLVGSGLAAVTTPLKLIGAPGSITFLVVCVTVGLMLVRMCPGRPMLSIAWFGLLGTVYLVLATPVVAIRIGDALVAAHQPTDLQRLTPVDLLVVFDTEVVDLSDAMDDPVEVLFSVQLGGGTDINRAVGYCASRITRPEDTVLVLISDLYEGGVEAGLLAQAQRLVSAGVQVVALLALSDEGAPAYDRGLAARLVALGVPAFACTPDLFPDLMAAAIRKQDLSAWAAGAGIAAVPAAPRAGEA